MGLVGTERDIGRLDALRQLRAIRNGDVRLATPWIAVDLDSLVFCCIQELVHAGLDLSVTGVYSENKCLQLFTLLTGEGFEPIDMYAV
jgi:hypothetical protein